jgi:histidine phosphotransferase ChpT
MSVTIDLRVLELVCSRICHDLVSPVGAINNGVELIREITDENSLNSGLEAEALALIAHSAEQGSRRLRVLRLAYGAAGADANWDELRGALDQFFMGSRIVLVWPPEPPLVMASLRGLGKVLVNGILLAADSLGQNGTIRMENRGGGIVAVANGRAPGLDAEKSAALAGRTAAADLDPRSIHAYVTSRFAAHYGIGFAAVTVGPEQLEFHIAMS